MKCPSTAPEVCVSKRLSAQITHTVSVWTLRWACFIVIDESINCCWTPRVTVLSGETAASRFNPSCLRSSIWMMSFCASISLCISIGNGFILDKTYFVNLTFPPPQLQMTQLVKVDDIVIGSGGGCCHGAIT